MQDALARAVPLERVAGHAANTAHAAASVHLTACNVARWVAAQVLNDDTWHRCRLALKRAASGKACALVLHCCVCCAGGC